MAWTSNVAAPNVVPYSHPEASTSSPVNPAQTLISPIQYGGLQPSPSMTTLSASSSTHTLTTLGLGINQTTVRESFMQGLDSSTIATMIQSFVAANPSPTPLTPIVDALFEAISSETSPNAFDSGAIGYLRRFLEASTYFPPSIVHAGIAGPLAGPRAIQMQIRKYSTWIPTAPSRIMNSHSQQQQQQQQQPQQQQQQQRSTPQASSSSTSPNSISDEMQRIATDRQRRKDHIQWARIHGAALELGMLAMGRVGEADNSGYAYAMSRAFSEMMARDAVWESDEVEWVAGICVLRAVIRTAMRGDRRQRDEYDDLLRTYEGRWKEIKDEARQALVTVSLFPSNLITTYVLLGDSTSRERRFGKIRGVYTLVLLSIPVMMHCFLYVCMYLLRLLLDPVCLPCRLSKDFEQENS